MFKKAAVGQRKGLSVGNFIDTGVTVIHHHHKGRFHTLNNLFTCHFMKNDNLTWPKARLKGAWTHRGRPFQQLSVENCEEPQHVSSSCVKIIPNIVQTLLKYFSECTWYFTPVWYFSKNNFTQQLFWKSLQIRDN